MATQAQVDAARAAYVAAQAATAAARAAVVSAAATEATALRTFTLTHEQFAQASQGQNAPAGTPGALTNKTGIF